MKAIEFGVARPIVILGDHCEQAVDGRLGGACGDGAERVKGVGRVALLEACGGEVARGGEEIGVRPRDDGEQRFGLGQTWRRARREQAGEVHRGGSMGGFNRKGVSVCGFSTGRVPSPTVDVAEN